MSHSPIHRNQERIHDQTPTETCAGCSKEDLRLTSGFCADCAKGLGDKVFNTEKK